VAGHAVQRLDLTAVTLGGARIDQTPGAQDVGGPHLVFGVYLGDEAAHGA